MRQRKKDSFASHSACGCAGKRAINHLTELAFRYTLTRTRRAITLHGKRVGVEQSNLQRTIRISHCFHKHCCLRGAWWSIGCTVAQQTTLNLKTTTVKSFVYVERLLPSQQNQLRKGLHIVSQSPRVYS